MNPLATMRSIPKTLPEMPTITIYGPKVCPDCQRAIDMLERKQIPFTKIDLEAGDANYLYVTQELGYLRAPVIVVKHRERILAHWGGHRMDMLTALTKLCTRGIGQKAEESAA